MTLSAIDAATECPERTALVVGDAAVSFAELATDVRRNVAWLEAKGFDRRSTDSVALVGSADRATLELVYALIEVGQSMALVHPRLTPVERQALFDLFPADRVLDAREPRRPGAEANPFRHEVDDEAGLAVVFTSGTTGRPKGVVLSRRAFVASARASEQNLGWRDDDRWLLGLPIAHVGGLSILTRCLLARKTVVVPREITEGQRLTAEGIARAIEQHGVTLLSLVPTQLEWLLSADSSWRPPSHLRAVLLGGAPARPALLARAADLGVPVLTTYGLTEACSQVTTQVCGTANRGDLGSGRPLPGTEVRIAPGGAIEVRGPTLLSAYFPGVYATALDPEGWLRTDDVGRIDENGNLHVLGRRSDCVITGGENVYPAEVEAILEACPAVARACVFGVPDDVWGETLAVAIVPAGKENLAQIIEFSRSRLAPHRRPRRMVFVGSFTTNETGKLDRRATAASVRERLRPVRY